MATPLRIATFVSHYHGAASLDALLSLDWLQVVLLATDDPLLPHANAANRLWSHGWDEELRTCITRRGEAAGLTAYTGRILDREFLQRFADCRPDAIVCNVFGQRIPGRMLQHVGYRAYNLHPTVPGLSLEATRGARAIHKGAEYSTGLIDFSLHRMSVEFDCGEILARSEPIVAPDSLRDLRNSTETLEFYRASADLPASVIRGHLRGIVTRDLAEQFAVATLDG